MVEDLVQDLVVGLAEDCATPRALTVAILVRSHEWLQLLELKVDPSCYLERDVDKLRRDLAVTDLLRKCKLPWLSLRTRDAAVETFWSCESQNALTNARLRRFLPDHLLLEPSDGPILSFVERVREEIASVLPAVPLRLTPRFSGGATLSDKGKYITLPDKLDSRPTVYDHTWDLLDVSFWDTAWGALHRENAPERARSNKFFTVPKDTTKDRGCCKEASINVTLQLAAAAPLRGALRKWNIDLIRNQELHRALAREGSKRDHLATIDLSNASDTVSRVLVELLLPKKWFELLNSLRATHTEIDGQHVRLEKFSSMGNGFTFELETLIFAGIARAVTKVAGEDVNSVLAYGDDLIVPSGAAKLLCKVLSFFGFTPNAKKTYDMGLFRESCGGDYFNGVRVRPHYIKELPSEPHELIALANGLRRLDLPCVFRTWKKVLSWIPSATRRCRGPEWLGDLVIHDHESTWQLKRLKLVPTSTLRPFGESVIGIRVWQPVLQKLDYRHWKPSVVLCAALIGSPSTGVVPRGAALGHRLSWVPLQEPCSHGSQVERRGPVFR